MLSFQKRTFCVRVAAALVFCLHCQPLFSSSELAPVNAHVLPIPELNLIVPASASASELQVGTVNVTQLENGPTVIDINRPNQAGVSHNHYTEFNVGSQGVAFNNHNGATPIALSSPNETTHWIERNPNFDVQLGSQGGSAQIILNEVVGVHDSQLNGMLEVVGNRADVVIANPNGISCQGCGFINVSRVMLVTGTPSLDSTTGALHALLVKQGKISIGTEGLLSYGKPKIDLVSVNILIHGPIADTTPVQAVGDDRATDNKFVSDIRVVAGAHDVDYATLTTRAHTHPVAHKRTAIDVGLLGGMYAQRIMLVSTSAGVGVKSTGVIHATHDLTVDVNGDIKTSGVLRAGKNIAIDHASSFINLGRVEAEDSDVTLTQVSTLVNGGLLSPGTISASKNIYLDVQTIENNTHSLIKAETGNITAPRLLDSALSQHVAFNNFGTLFAENNLQLIADPKTGEQATFLNHDSGKLHANYYRAGWDCAGDDGVCLARKNGQGAIVFANQAAIAPTGWTEWSMSTTHQGRKLIHLVAPNSRGLSHNYFDQFNIQNNSLVLNNYSGVEKKILVQKNQQGEFDYVRKNPYFLENQSASLILIEVQQAFSELRGIVEIAGQDADLIIANPHGLSANGLGFINTKRVMLTTGLPTFQAENALFLNTSKGDISIGYGGVFLSGSHQNSASELDLVARKITVDGSIRSTNESAIKEVRLTSGETSLNYLDHSLVLNNKLAAIDSGIVINPLGEISAQKITLLSTDLAGIHSAGNLYTISNMSMTSHGPLILSGMTYAQGDMDLSSTHQHILGMLAATGKLSLTAHTGDIKHTGWMSADSNIIFNAQKGSVLNEYGSVQAKAGLDIYAQHFKNIGGRLRNIGNLCHLRGACDINITVTAELKNGDDALIDSKRMGQSTIFTKQGAVNLMADQLLNSGVIYAGSETKQSTLKVQGSLFNNSGLINISNSLSLDLQGKVSQRNDGKFEIGKNLHINLAHPFLNFGYIYSRQGVVSMVGSSVFVNEGGVVSANGLANSHVSIKLNRFENKKDAAIISQHGDIYIESFSDFFDAGELKTRAIDNAGTIFSGRHTVLKLDSNRAGRQVSLFNEQGALIQAKGNLIIGRDCLADAGSQCIQSIWHHSSGNIIVENYGNIVSDKNIWVNANVFINNIAHPEIVEESRVVRRIGQGHSGRYGACTDFSISCRSGDGRERIGYYHHKIFSSYFWNDWYELETRKEKFKNNIAAHIPLFLAKEDLTIRTQDGENLGGTLAAGKKFTLTALNSANTFARFTNLGLVTYQYEREVLSGRDGYEDRINTSKTGGNSVNNARDRFRFGYARDTQEVDRKSFCQSTDTPACVKKIARANPIGGVIQSGEAADITINQFTHQGNTIALGERTTAVISFNTATSFFKDYILPVGKHGLFIFNPAVLDKKQMTERAGNVSPPLHLIQANPLFSHTSAPWSSVYLSNMLFANQTSKKLDWQKRLRLGDGHYEEKLIADQILAKTGRAWLSNGDTHFVDRATQFKQLMDNAVSHAHFAFGGDTDFYLGHMLTRAQEKQLSKDIVWLARHDMGAHPDILVPEVYLSPLTQSRLLGATLVAHKIDLNVTTLDNQGGAIEATQALYINASGAVINRSGKMQGETVNITAASLFNETVVHRYGELNNITDLAGKTAMITAKAGDISVQTKGDITQIGGHMHAAKKIDLQVGSKVQVTALALQMPSESTSHYETGLAQSKSVVVTTKQEKKLASELSGEGVVIRSQGNMVFVGADIKGTGKLESEHGNVTFQALSLLSAQRTETKISTLLMPKYEPNSTTALWKFGVENQSIVQTEVKKIFSPTSVAHDGFEVLAKNGDIDLGGGDYIASSESSKPVFKMSAKKIKPQKHVDTVTVDTKLITTFTGLQAEVHSSFAVIADDKKRNSENTEKLDQHMNALAAMDLASGSKAIRGDAAQYRETAIKLAQAAGAFSSFAFDDLLGTSLKISAETSTDEVTHQTKKERRNHIRAHHIIIQQTEGDLHLAGIDVAATPSGEISFEAPGAIHLSFAKSDETQTTTNIQNDLSIGLAASIDRRGAGASVDVDYHFVLGKGQATWHRPMVSVIAGDLVKIKSGGDTQLEGVKITADVFDADIGGAFRITSEQHTKTEQHTQAGTSVSLGVNVNTVSVYGVNGHLQPEGSAMWESAALTVIQSGITSKKMTGAVKGDLDLVGSHLLVTDPQKKEAFSVGGKVSGKKIHDTIDKNGFSGSFGAGITRTGMPTVSLEANPAEKIDYKAEQQATLNVVLTTTDGSPALVEGELNPDSTRLVNVTQAEYVERADIKFIVGDIDAHSKQPKKKSKQLQSEALVYAFAKLSADGKQVKKMVEETDSKKHTVTHDINKIKQTLSQVEVLKKQIDDATAQRDQDQSRLDEYASLLKNHDEKTMEDRYAARSAEYFRKTKEYRDLILLHLAEADVSYESGAWLESARQRAEHDSVMKTYYDEYIKFEYWHTAASTAYENDRENYRTEIDMLQKKIVTANDIIANDNKQVGVYRSDLKKDLINALTHKQRAVDNDALSQQKVEALERALNESISATTNDYKEQATQQVEQIKADAQASAAHINQMKNSLDGLDQPSIIRFLSEDTQPNAVHSTSPTLESWFADVFPHRPSDEKTRRVSTLVLVPQMLKDNMDQLVSEVYAHSEVDKPSQKLQTLFEHDAPTGLKNISDESQISTPSSSSDNDADQINTPRAKHVISPETKMFLSLNLLTTKLKRKNYDRAIKAYLGSLVPKLYSNKPGDPQILAAKVAYAQQMIDTVKRMLDEGKSNDDIKSFLKIDSTSTMPVPNQDISDLDTSRLDGGEDGFQ